MSNSANARGIASESIASTHKRDFWIIENQKLAVPHYRLQKSARIINAAAQGRECNLLDIGCGSATLMRLLQPNIHYHGIDIAVHDPTPNLIETDILATPIRFGDMRFEIIVALGLFEYLGGFQSQKLKEIAVLLSERGKFIVTYTNFNHRDARVTEAFSNVQPPDSFRRDLAHYFRIDRSFPVSHNWHGGQPSRELVKALNMHVNVNIPYISPRLAVDYFFVCSSR